MASSVTKRSIHETRRRHPGGAHVEQAILLEDGILLQATSAAQLDGVQPGSAVKVLYVDNGDKKEIQEILALISLPSISTGGRKPPVTGGGRQVPAGSGALTLELWRSLV